MAMASVNPKSIVDSLRDIVQDLLVPELKSIKVSIDSLHTGITLLVDKQTQAIEHLSGKLDFALDIRERLASVEARLQRNN